MIENGIAFIADISGYTQFLSATDIEHANFVMVNLFSSMMEETPLRLKVIDVEGDALFCWLPMERRPESFDPIFRLIDHQFRRFIGVQRWFGEIRGRHCGCRACLTVKDLKIKFVAHYGKSSSYKIANFEKIAGLDVVIAHRLMKNSVPEEEYILVTHTLGPSIAAEAERGGWIEGEDIYPIVGKISYSYRKLERNAVAELIEPPFADRIDRIIVHE